jgi:tetratricopeptide (TPR) repeat protein
MKLGNRLGQATVHQNLGVLAEWQGRYADALNDVGYFHGLLGDYQQARAFCRQALTLSAEVGHFRLEGGSWDSLGYAEHHLGNLAEAAACYQRALNLHRESGDRSDEAVTLTHLGDTCHAAGKLAQAREAWQQALAVFDDLQHPHTDQVRAKLASTNDHASPNPLA